MIQNLMTGSGGFNALPKFEYTGQYQLINDGKADKTQNWRIKFLTSGILTFKSDPGDIDVFMVGGGGGGSTKTGGGAGGGGGYTKTINYKPVKNEPYEIVVGDGGAAGAAGGDTAAFGASIGGGLSTDGHVGADGGSGGGGGKGAGGSTDRGGDGGSDGGDGASSRTSSIAYAGGIGQGTTTREFGAAVTNAYIVGEVPMAAGWLSLTEGGEALTPSEGVICSVLTSGDYWYRDFIWDGTAYAETDTARVYAGGGGGSAQDVAGIGGAGGGGTGAKGSSGASTSGAVNTGGGGGGGYNEVGSDGGSGIVVIRNRRGVTA